MKVPRIVLTGCLVAGTVVALAACGLELRSQQQRHVAVSTTAACAAVRPLTSIRASRCWAR